MDLSTLLDFTTAIYPELVIAILFITELLKKVSFLKKVNARVLTAVVGVVCTTVDIIFRADFSMWAILISFAIANGFYSYVWKALKPAESEVQD